METSNNEEPETIQRRDSVSNAIRSKTLNEETRTVEAVISTDQPVDMWDYRMDDIIPEILPPSAMVVRGNSLTVPVLNSHKRSDVSDIAGSASLFTVSGGDLISTLRIDDDEDSNKVFRKIKSKSLTDLSVGYEVLESRYLSDGETMKLGGRTYTGPAKVATRWELQEVSAVPIGADNKAKFRALKNKSGNSAGANQPKEEGFPVEDSPKAPVAKPEERSAPVSVAPVVDENKIRSEAVRAERERTNEIRSIATQAGVDKTKVDEAIDNDVTVDAFRKIALEAVAERNKQITSKADGERIEVGTGQREKKRAAMTDGILLRAGVKPEKPADGANEYRGYSLLELARESLVESGIDARKVMKMDREEAFERALSRNGRDLYRPGKRSAYSHTTSDFPLILADVMNKSAQSPYVLANSTWRQWCSTGSVSDFKNKKVVKLSDGKVPEKILENGEIPQSNFSEAQEQYRVYTYGQIVSITRETLINDDLSVFTRIPQSMSAQYERLIEQKVYSILLANTLTGETMADGNNIFDASNHSNYTSTGTAVSVASLQVANTLMAKQTGPNGSILNIRPEYLLCGPEIAGTVAQIINSTVDPSKSNSAINPYANSLKVISSPYLTSAFTFDGTAYNTGPDTNHWYLAGNANMIDTVEVSFLNGNDALSFQEEEGFETLGMRVRCVGDFGAKAIDWRGLYRNAGA